MTEIRMPGVKYGFDASYAARTELEEKASTEAIVNQAAHKAGYLRDRDGVHFTGDDRTYAETKAGQSPYAGMNAGTLTNGADALEKALEIASMFSKSHLLESVAEGASLAALPVSLVGMVHDQAEAWDNGEARSEALHRDMMHVAMMSVLSLPEGFKEAEASKRPEVVSSPNSPAQLISEQLNFQSSAKVVLQVRCDEGMHVAEQFSQSGRSLDDFMKCNDGYAKRYHLDAAFRAGFDAMVWAHGQGPDELKKATTELHSRDARFDANSNRVWTA